MWSPHFIRWGGLAAILAGPLLIVTVLLASMGIGSSFLNGLITLLLLAALTGFRTRQAARVGNLGLLGFGLAIFGAATLTILLVVDGTAQAFFGFRWGTDSVLGLILPFGVLLGVLALLFGLAVFGFATARAGVLPRWAAVMLAVGLPLALAGIALPGQWAAIVCSSAGVTAFAMGLVWLGYELWSTRGTSHQPMQLSARSFTLTVASLFLLVFALLTTYIYFLNEPEDMSAGPLLTTAEGTHADETGSPPVDGNDEAEAIAGSPPGEDGSDGEDGQDLPASLETVDLILAHLEQSNIAFNTPEQIRLEETVSIRLLLSPSAPVEELTQQVEESGGSGKIESAEQIVTSSRMQARLTGQDFEIVANSPEVQAVSYTEPTEWTWDVKPIKPGEKKLHLTVSALIPVEGETALRTVESFDRAIPVNVTWGQRLSGFVGTNWQWLWTTLLIPIALWGWSKWKKRNGENERFIGPPSQRVGR